MNVYDFDKTIFYPDSSYTFVRFCLRHYTRAVMYSLPKIAVGAYNYAVGKTGKAGLKSGIFSFLSRIDNIDCVVEEFWNANSYRIGQWYIDHKREDDIIISASPEFLLRPIADKLGVTLICTPMDKATGLIFGENCWGEEKVRRFCELYPDAHIDSFYSDSLSDTPMAMLADNAFIVDNGQVSPWPRINK